MKLFPWETLWFAASLLVADSATASTQDCQDLYVGRIWIEKGTGLRGAVFLNDPSDVSGSFWVWFEDWSSEDKKSALATLTAAKMMQHRVNIATTEADECGIATSWRYAKSLYLTTQP